MKKTLKVIAVLLLVLLTIIAIPAFIPDDEYTPGAKQWLDEANTMVELPVAQNSFNALVGFSLREGKDTIAVGAAMVSEVNKRTIQYRAGGKTKPVVDPRWMEEELKLTDEWLTLADKLFDKDPVQWLRKNPDSYQKLLVDNHVLLSRYRQLTTMKQYSNYIIPDINAPFISLNGLMSTSKLNNLSIIHDYTNGRQKSAINRLSDSINYSRLMLKESRLLINKIVAWAMLSKNLNTYSILQDSDSFKPEYRLHIKNLDNQERTMRRVFQTEFAFMSTAFIGPNMDSLGEDAMDTPILDDVYAKLYLKHKRLENMAHKKIWVPLLAQESMTLAQRTMQNNTDNDDASWWDYYVDPVGTILLNIATPSYVGYIDTIDHANAYISLLNVKNEILAKNMTNDEIKKYITSFELSTNPGYSDATMTLNKDDGTLTYVIPGYTDEKIPSLII